MGLARWCRMRFTVCVDHRGARCRQVRLKEWLDAVPTLSNKRRPRALLSCLIFGSTNGCVAHSRRCKTQLRVVEVGRRKDLVSPFLVDRLLLLRHFCMRSKLMRKTTGNRSTNSRNSSMETPYRQPSEMEKVVLCQQDSK